MKNFYKQHRIKILGGLTGLFFFLTFVHWASAIPITVPAGGTGVGRFPRNTLLASGTTTATSILSATSTPYVDSINASATFENLLKPVGSETMAWAKEPNMFSENEMAIHKAPSNQIELSFKVYSVVFEDGTKVELLYPDIL